MSSAALLVAGGSGWIFCNNLGIPPYALPRVITKKALVEIAEDLGAKVTPSESEKIDEVVEILKQCEQPEMPVTHRFSPGIYCREIFMPALPDGGTLVVGHIHKTKHQNIVLTGKAIVTIGDERLEITAPFVFESDAGAQKLLHIIEDMRWLTIHANPDNITDIPTIENMIFDLPEEIQASGIPLDDFRMARNLVLKGDAR